MILFLIKNRKAGQLIGLSIFFAILDSKVTSSAYQLSNFQKERISLGREQLKNGQVISNEDLQPEIDQWLSTK